MKKIKVSTEFIVKSAVIAALYTVLTVVVAPISFGMVQCRIAEALCILCAFTPAAVPGLAVGCMIANVFSFNPIDIVFGTFATLVAAICARKLRNVRWGGIAWLVPLPAVLVNMLIVGLELAIYCPLEGKSFLVGFCLQALSVGAGQMVACYILGIPLFIMINKSNLKNLINE